MSTQKSDQSAAGAVVFQKPATNIYTVMLMIALIALVISCVLLYIQLDSYGEWPPWNKRLPSVAAMVVHSGQGGVLPANFFDA